MKITIEIDDCKIEIDDENNSEGEYTLLNATEKTDRLIRIINSAATNICTMLQQRGTSK